MTEVEKRLAKLETELMTQYAFNLALMQLLTMLWREDLKRDEPDLAKAKVERLLEIVESVDFNIKVPRGAHPVQGDFVSAHVKETMEGFLKRLLS